MSVDLVRALLETGALRLAPERESAIEEGPPLPQNSERAVTTMKAFTLGLP